MIKEKVYLWGTGKIAQEVMEECDLGFKYEVLGFIDNDDSKQGKYYFGKEIFSPQKLLDGNFDKIFVLSSYIEEIRKQIKELDNQMENRVESFRFLYKQSLLNRYKDSEDPEIKEIVDFLEHNELKVFNYDFVREYENLEVTPVFDMNCGMFYVMYNDKKMYFSRKFKTEEAVKSYYKHILMEQDVKSPHRYLGNRMNVEPGAVVVDLGVAEGNFALDVIDRVSKLYIIEADADWVEALKESFKNYGDKVEIIQSFVSSVDEGKMHTLDSLISDKIDFIKMDIEGYEWDALIGAKKLIQNSPHLSCAICCYHSDYDEILIKNILRDYGLECNTSDGYMWFPEKGRKNYISTKLCRGLVYGKKHSY